CSEGDPEIMAQIAANDYLDYLVRTRCSACPSLQVARQVKVVEIQVWEYSARKARVYSVIEWGWNMVSPVSGKSTGPCHAETTSEVTIFIKQGDTWKVAGGEGEYLNSVVDSPELLARNCSGN
ncbi:MAG: hypothetical protein ABI847_20440, partial [Anaerolineales bacterium]